MHDKQQQLNEIAEQIITDGVCPELAASATQLVFGTGSPDADVVFIGEAPGKKEDERGEPFVGAAGKFLNEMLESIGLERKDVYITNIVKYRPPDNRDPSREEKAAFWPYLLRQLEIIRPKLIVTLGRHSMEYFLPEMRISQIHGQPKRVRISNKKKAKSNKEKNHITAKTSGDTSPKRAGRQGEQAATSWVILPLYHPAAALYNGGQRQTLLDDFAKVPKVLELAEQKNNAKINEQEAK